MKTEIYLTIAGSLIVGLSWTVFVLMVTIGQLERKIERQQALITNIISTKPTFWDWFVSLISKAKNNEPNKNTGQKSIGNANNALVPVFKPPFRIGRKQMRAVVDARGIQLVVFPEGLEQYAKEYADFLNSNRQNH